MDLIGDGDEDHLAVSDGRRSADGRADLFAPKDGARRGIERQRLAEGGGGIEALAVGGETAAEGSLAVLAVGHERAGPGGAAALRREGADGGLGIENEDSAASDDGTGGEPAVAA